MFSSGLGAGETRIPIVPDTPPFRSGRTDEPNDQGRDRQTLSLRRSQSDYWQFPTVSMGLGPLMAIYQARFLKYLHARGFADTANRHVWAFLGDGEMDEPESL